MGSKPIDMNGKNISGAKERGLPKCWGCCEPHLLRDCPHNPRSDQNIQVFHEATIMNDIARNIPRKKEALEDRQEEHQSIIIDMEDTLSNQHVFILIDSRASFIYIGPQVVEQCKQKTKKYNTP